MNIRNLRNKKNKIKSSKEEEILFDKAEIKNKRFSNVKANNFKDSMIKLIRYLKPYYLLIFISFICISLSTIISILAPRKLSDLTNVIETAMINLGSTTVNIDMDKIKNIGITLILMYIANAVLNYLQSFNMSGIIQNLSKKLRNDISLKINRLPLKYYDAKPYGDTLSRVTNDVDTIAQSLNHAISSLISSVIMLICVLIGMMITSWQLTLTAITTVPLSIFIMTLIIKISQKYFVRQQKYLGAVNGTVEEIYSGQSVVKVFNAGEKVEKAFIEYNTNLRKSAYLSHAISSILYPANSFVSKLGYVAICVVGGTLYSQGKISMGTIVAFFVYVNMFQNPINQLSQVTNTLQSAAAASERVFEFLEEEEQSDESHKELVLEPLEIKGKVEFRNVKFGYLPNQTIIHNFNAIIQPGQKVAIVGPTGAGKTTIVNLLMGFYEVDEGEILIDDVPISSLTRENIRNLFSMVLQDTWIFDGTVGENIIYTKAGVNQTMLDQVAKAANLNHFINSLPHGYDSKLDSDTNISGGQKQLITIARAMLRNSPIMILDEATSNVDTRTEVLIQEAMDNLSKGRTSFVIAHRLSTIKNADIILVLKDGDIIEQGNHKELLEQNGFYANLYHSQFSGYIAEQKV